MYWSDVCVFAYAKINYLFRQHYQINVVLSVKSSAQIHLHILNRNIHTYGLAGDFYVASH